MANWSAGPRYGWRVRAAVVVMRSMRWQKKLVALLLNGDVNGV